MNRGSLVLVGLDPTLGHEQQGTRPCIVVSDPVAARHQRFPAIAVVPVTGTAGEGSLYPRLEPGPSGLVKVSWALVDHLRSVDKRRVLRRWGEVSPDELRAIDEGLKLFLHLT